MNIFEDQYFSFARICFKTEFWELKVSEMIYLHFQIDKKLVANKGISVLLSLS